MGRVSSSPSRESYGNVRKILTYSYQMDQMNERVVACLTSEGELIVMDVKEAELLWRTQKQHTRFMRRCHDSIFTITSEGDIETYNSLDRNCTVMEQDHKIVRPEKISVHPDESFLLVSTEHGEMFLIDDRVKVFLLCLPPPPPPPPDSEQQPNGVEYTEELLQDIAFFRHSDDKHLAIALVRKTSAVFVIMTRSGKVRQHLSLNCKIVLSSSLSSGRRFCKLVSVEGGYVQKRAISCQSGGFRVQQIWRKPLPHHLVRYPQYVIAAGDKFLLSRRGTTLEVYRLGCGKLALVSSHCHFHDFFLGIKPVTSAMPRCTYDRIEDIVGDIQRKETWRLLERRQSAAKLDNHPERLYLINVDWLDGLSELRVNPEIPVAILFNSLYRHGKCLRWSGDVWVKLLKSNS